MAEYTYFPIKDAYISHHQDEPPQQYLLSMVSGLAVAITNISFAHLQKGYFICHRIGGFLLNISDFQI